jgi:hypothetical protein
MVKVTHKLGDKKVSSDQKEGSFFLTNKRGGFVHLPLFENTSRYQGAFFFNGDMFKIIDSVHLQENKVEEIINNFYNIQRISGDTIETFFMNSHDAFTYIVENYSGKIRLFLDMRQINDFDDKGRIYKIEKKDDSLLISYKKYKDASLNEENYSLYFL